MFKLFVDYSPNQTDNDFLKEVMVRFNEDNLGEREKSFSIYLKDNDGKILAGLQAGIDSESLFVDLLWVEEKLRNQGFGKKLLETAEKEAIKKGCHFSTTDTFDFQAEGFYLKNGYERIGEIKNYTLGHSRIFLRKLLK